MGGSERSISPYMQDEGHKAYSGYQQAKQITMLYYIPSRELEMCRNNHSSTCIRTKLIHEAK